MAPPPGPTGSSVLHPSQATYPAFLDIWTNICPLLAPELERVAARAAEPRYMDGAKVARVMQKLLDRIMGVACRKGMAAQVGSSVGSREGGCFKGGWLQLHPVLIFIYPLPWPRGAPPRSLFQLLPPLPLSPDGQ